MIKCRVPLPYNDHPPHIKHTHRSPSKSFLLLPVSRWWEMRIILRTIFVSPYPACWSSSAATTAMVCGLVDIEFCKLVLGLQSKGSEQFLNSNINLAAGSGNFTTFAPDPPVPILTGLDSPQPESFTSWGKLSCCRIYFVS